MKALGIFLLFGVLLLSACKTVKSTAPVDEEKLKAATVFDYSDWTYVLNAYVNDDGKVNYMVLNGDRAALDRFVATIGQVGPNRRPDLFRTRNQKLAYYINAYNALTMFNVINRYPAIKTVNDSQVDFFVTTSFPLDDDEVSLYDLENKLIRPVFQDPRVHFALNCASGGCPILPNTVFMPATLDEQLDAQTQIFLHEPRNISVTGGKVALSNIFKWYKDDFSPSPLGWIKAKAPDLALTATEVEHCEYDWTLNDQARQWTRKPCVSK